MIAEAVDAAVTLGWALLGGGVLLAFTATVALYAVVVTAAVAWLAVTRGIAAGLAAIQGSRAPESPPGPQKAAEARVAHSRPSWAQPDKDAA